MNDDMCASPNDDESIVSAKEAIKYLPGVSQPALTKHRRNGTGPKFGLVSNRVAYIVRDLLEWHKKWKSRAFNQTSSRRLTKRKNRDDVLA